MTLAFSFHNKQKVSGSSSANPALNGKLTYPDNIDESLNKTVNVKISKYHVDYNNNPPNTVAFMTAIACTTGRLHSDFIRLLFLQSHRETDRFLATSGVQSAQSNLGSSYFHFRPHGRDNFQKIILTQTPSLGRIIQTKQTFSSVPRTRTQIRELDLKKLGVE